MDLSGLTVPIFTVVWGMGWAACYATLVRPMQSRLTAMDAKLSAIEAAKDQRIAVLERKILGLGGDK